MADLAALPKGDRSRVVRRPVRPEDGISDKAATSGGSAAAKALVALYAGALAGLALFGVYAASAWATGQQVDVLAGAALCLAVGIGICALSIFRRGPSRGAAALMRQDADAGEIDELILDVAEAKAFREPEHGGLMYFLKLDDGRVFFDVPGGDLPDAGWERQPDAIPAEDMPRRRLHLLFGAASGRLIATRRSGEAVPPVSVSTIKGNPAYWPAEATFRKTAWDDIEAQFAAR